MKALAAASLVVAAGMGVLEVVMRPASSDRLDVLALFVTMALVTVAVAQWMPRLAASARTLSRTIAAVGLVAVALTTLAVLVGSWQMFLSVHDLQLLIVVLFVSASLGVIFAISVASSLNTDLAVLRRTAEQVSGGHLAVRTGVTRADELGAAATALDEMIGRLAVAEDQRRHDESARRTLLAAVGHDLRTPLAALQAAIEALQDGLATEPDRYLRSMSHDVVHLGQLVDDLFLLARIEAGDFNQERQHVDLAELVDETIEAMEPIARRQQVELCLETTSRVPVLGSPEALGRVMRNLVDNAIRHAPPSGHVVVRVLSGESATVEIIDDGPGFDADLLPGAFDSFVRADPSRSRDTGGAGLGLAIAKGVIEAHGGEISATPGPGGRVWFRLPLVRS